MTSEAILLVSRALEENKLGVTKADLIAKDNPIGAGVFVYVAKTRFYDVKRNVVWMVIDSRAFALNSPAKLVTPTLPWPREGDDAVWDKTKIDMYSGAHQAVQILYEDLPA